MLNKSICNMCTLRDALKHSPIPKNIIKIIFPFLMLVFVKVRNNKRKKKRAGFFGILLLKSSLHQYKSFEFRSSKVLFRLA